MSTSNFLAKLETALSDVATIAKANEYFSVWSDQNADFQRNRRQCGYGSLTEAFLSAVLGKIPEERDVLSLSTEEMRHLPPVVFIGGTFGERILKPEDMYARIIGYVDFIQVSEVCSDAPSVLAALSAYCDYRSEDLDNKRTEKAANLARAFWRWYELQSNVLTIGQSEITPFLNERLRLQTHQALNAGTDAFSRPDAFAPNKTGDAVYQSLGDFTVVIGAFSETVDAHIYTPEPFDEIKTKLQSFNGKNLWSPFVSIISKAIEHDRVNLEIDELAKAVGLKPRSSQERLEHRKMLWSAIRIFAQSRVTGTLRKLKDDRGNPLVLDSPFIAITGRYYANGTSTPDRKDETPLYVSFTAGDFFYRYRQQHKHLPDIGNFSEVISIPAGQPSGDWAKSIGASLGRLWRIDATRAEVKRVGEDSHDTVKFPKITRRELFNCIRPTPDPFSILNGRNPIRAQEYWDLAVQILQDQGTAQLIGKAEPLPRQGWKDKWLDEPLDFRPHKRDKAEIIQDVKSILLGEKKHKKRPRRK